MPTPQRPVCADLLQGSTGSAQQYAELRRWALGAMLVWLAQVVAHELQLHAWNDVVADGREYVVDLMDDAGALYEKVRIARKTAEVVTASS